MWKQVDTADIPKLEEIMNSVDPGSQKWLRAQARLEKLRHEHDVAEARVQHQASYRLGSRTLRWTIVAALAAIVAALAALVVLLPSSCRGTTPAPGASETSSASATPVISSSVP